MSCGELQIKNPRPSDTYIRNMHHIVDVSLHGHSSHIITEYTFSCLLCSNFERYIDQIEVDAHFDTAWLHEIRKDPFL